LDQREALGLLPLHLGNLAHSLPLGWMGFGLSRHTSRRPRRCWEPSKQARCHGGESAARKEAGTKGHRFAAGMDGATSRLCVRTCPAVGTKLTGGTIPSPAQRRAHVGRWPEGGASGRGRRSTGRRRGATRYGGPGFGALSL